MGTVPMSRRRDPIVGLGEAVRRMERKCAALADETEEYLMCGTSFINVFPNNAVNVPQQVRAAPVPRLFSSNPMTLLLGDRAAMRL